MIGLLGLLCLVNLCKSDEPESLTSLGYFESFDLGLGYASNLKYRLIITFLKMA